MKPLPQNLKYSTTHEWVRIDNEIATVGISDHAQALLGDVVFVELPEIGKTLSSGDEIAVVESVKAAADVYSPVPGQVTAVNPKLQDSPELINQDPYDQGWLFQIRLQGDLPFTLLSAEDYQALLDAE